MAGQRLMRGCGRGLRNGEGGGKKVMGRKKVDGGDGGGGRGRGRGGFGG